MKLHELKPAEGSKKAPKRIGRGTGSGKEEMLVKVKKVKMQDQVVE